MRWINGLLATFICAAMVMSLLADDESGFVSLFDGKTLDGWDGDPRFWSVQDGLIVGQTTAENPTQGNTFLIYKGSEPADFELRFDYKIIGGNSGVQYRSFIPDPDQAPWVMGGYQADFEAGKRYSGILYGERFRGILANRGQKTELVRKEGEFKVNVVGKVGDSDEIQAQINHEDWNRYVVRAEGYDFIHKINDAVTIECTDLDEQQRRAAGLIGLQLHAGPPMKVLFRNIRIKLLGKGKDQAKAVTPRKRIAFLAGGPSHGPGSHEHYAGSMLLAQSLLEAIPDYQVQVFREGWPETGVAALADADAIVVYCDGGGRHLLNPHVAEFDALMDQGKGLVCLHYAVETPKGETGDAFLKWMGGYFETNWSVNPHWDAEFKELPKHPITRGVEPFTIRDEWYYHMRFRDAMDGVTPILSAHPGEETLRRPDGPHSGNPDVRKAVQSGQIQHVAWASEREGGGRGFGFTGGHFHHNWADHNFRRIVLNAIVWTAQDDVPDTGVPIRELSAAELEANQDKPKAAVQPKPKAGRKLVTTTLKRAATDAAAKPLFSSDVITTRTPGNEVQIDVALGQSRDLFLVVTDGGDGFSCDWAAWAEPRLLGPAGELKLTDLNWRSASADWGSVQKNRNATGGPIMIKGQEVGYGIGTHANSVIAFTIPAGYNRFKARGGIDDGGASQNAGAASSIQFKVYDQSPPASSTGGASRDPVDALDALTVGEGLAASLFAAEPMLLSPSAIDIDHRGRVWVCEIVNYRRHGGTRDEGDRILILEDTNGDGAVDSQKVFYQGTDIDSPHGVCVLGNRVFVSAGSQVLVFTDEDGNDKPDRKEVLFSGIGGVQHDHGIHALSFGADGKLYFNFGNSGSQIKDKDGRPIIDLAGNEVVAQRQPYQEGMVFRCNLDGSEFETLGWNFRNNWMVAADSFGGLWQSDNDDDGNRAVRINFVMEFGNYGYRDERTGAGWKTQRTGMHAEIPQRHWHVNDPGVVPNLLLTGAGSPTGMQVYEGELLPMFRGHLLHCDPGPNACRGYILEDDGAGYKATIRNILTSSRDSWFRPVDVKTAPDGSLIVADWYDPGVGGHGMGDLDRGRLFRVMPYSHDGSNRQPQLDFATAAGAVAALQNPNNAVRYLAWQALQGMGDQAVEALRRMTQSADPIYRARALWVLGKMEGRGAKTVAQAITDADANVRCMGIRLARQLKLPLDAFAVSLVDDAAAKVRRELAIALRFDDSPQADELWAKLAMQHDGKDRWYLEALGIGADLHADNRFAAWQKQAESQWETAAGRDIVWRIRADAALPLLVKILQDESLPADQQDRYFRALDFHSGQQKDAALKSLLGL